MYLLGLWPRFIPDTENKPPPFQMGSIAPLRPLTPQPPFHSHALTPFPSRRCLFQKTLTHVSLCSPTDRQQQQDFLPLSSVAAAAPQLSEILSKGISRRGIPFVEGAAREAAPAAAAAGFCLLLSLALIANGAGSRNNSSSSNSNNNEAAAG